MDPSDRLSRSDAEPFDVIRPESMVGRTVEGRYRLESVTASGSTTVMFDAVDIGHDRSVTVKFVRPEICILPGFLGRFDDSQRAVSALEHPNLPVVYSWGSVPGVSGVTVAYVASERLSGGSLRDMYDRQRRLSPSQALALGLDVCRGLDHAHRHGFVHGELSPAKLVFGADRRVRIVDLGLSSLMIEHLWADPASLPTHVADYSAPEQARGGLAVAASDVYALSLILIEGVTGELPFVGDSTLATLEARIDRLMPVTADLGPLAAVLERAGRPEPAERSTAARFGRDLMGCAEKLPRPEPLDLFGEGLFDPVSAESDDTVPLDMSIDDTVPLGMSIDDTMPLDPMPSDSVSGDAAGDDTVPLDMSIDDTMPLEPVSIATEPIDPLLASTVGDPTEPIDVPDAVIDPLLAPTSSDPTEPIDASEMVIEVDAAPADAATVESSDLGAVADIEVSEPTTDHPEDVIGPSPVGLPPPGMPADQRVEADASSTPPGVRRRPIWVTRGLLPVLIIAALALLVLVAARLFITPSYEVPDLAGLDRAAAESEVADFGWSVEIANDRSDDEPRPGHVIRSVPAAGERLTRGEPFLLVISDGPEFRAFPDLVGLSEAEAREVLDELRLDPVILEDYDEEVAVGLVVRAFAVSEPMIAVGDDILPDEDVNVVISRGPAPRIIPDLTGRPEAEAIATLAELGLEVVVVEAVFDDVAPAGTIAALDPAAGTSVERGSTVTLTPSLGPDLVAFPDLSGTDFAEAQARLAAVGLEARLEFGSSDSAARFRSATIDGREVRAGESVRRPSVVSLVFF